MLHASPLVFCVGPSRLVREVTLVTSHDVQVRWAPDLASFRRCIGGMARGSVAACIVGVGGDGRATLEYVRSLMPRTRRCAVADASHAKIGQPLLESGIATDLLTRPLDEQALAAALSDVVRTPVPLQAAFNAPAPAMAALPA